MARGVTPPPNPPDGECEGFVCGRVFFSPSIFFVRVLSSKMKKARTPRRSSWVRTQKRTRKKKFRHERAEKEVTSPSCFFHHATSEAYSDILGERNTACDDIPSVVQPRARHRQTRVQGRTERDIGAFGKGTGKGERSHHVLKVKSGHSSKSQEAPFAKVRDLANAQTGATRLSPFP